MRLYFCKCGSSKFHMSVQFLADAKQAPWYSGHIYDFTHIEQGSGKGNVLTRSRWVCTSCGKEAKVRNLKIKEE